MERKLRLWLFAPIASLFVYFNIWVIYNYHGGGLYDGDCMTKAYFWRVAGRWGIPADLDKIITLKDNHDLFEGVPKNEQIVYQNNFANDTGGQYIPHPSDAGKTLLLDKDHQNQS